MAATTADAAMVVSLLVKVGRCILWQPLIICVFLCAISDLKTAPLRYVYVHRWYLLRSSSCYMAVEVEVEPGRLTLLSHRDTCLVTVT